MRATKEYLQSLADQIDAEAESAEEYARSEDSSHAEYAQSLGYGDGELELDRLEDEVKAKVDELRDILKLDAFRRVILECSELELGDIYTRANEVFSVSIGELESQLEDSLAAKIKALSPEDREALRGMTRNGYLGRTCPDCVYVSMDYDRWVMVLNEDALDRRLAGIRKTTAKRRPRLNPVQMRAQFRLVMGGAA